MDQNPKDLEHLAQQIAQVGSIFVYTMDPQSGEMTYLNQLASDILGKRTLDQALIHQDRELFKTQRTNLIAKGPGAKGDSLKRLTDQKGKELYYHFQEACIQLGDKVLVWGLGQDITTLKTTEREMIQAKRKTEHALKIKNRFIAFISHELQTPLNAILGSTDLLETKHSLHQDEDMVRLKRSAQYLGRTIRDLLELSELDMEFDETNLSAFSIKELLEGACSQAKSSAVSKGLDLEVGLEDGFHDAWTGDKRRIEQLLRVLLSNAINFNSSGCIKVAAQGTDDGITLQIMDPGQGPSLEEVRSIVDSGHFLEEDQHIARLPAGAALGLSLVKQLVQMLGGTIQPQEKAIHVNLPLSQAKKTMEKAEAKTLELSPPNGTYKVLLVEDNEDNALLVKNFLKKLPLEITHVVNGKLGVEAYEAGDYDAILMDVQMPVMDGYTATQKIREIENKKRRGPVPIVAVTAYTRDSEIDRAFEVGCSAHLGKPVKKRDLINTLAFQLEPDKEAA